MAKVLAVGIATLDIINEVDGYPREDTEVRALAQHIRRGGNATNTLVVLAQLGHACAWAGTLADDAQARIIRDELAHYHIDMTACQEIAGGTTPTSYVTLNRHNGSRTIVHYRDLPEYPFERFRQIPQADFQWLHLEGRNLEESEKILRYVASSRIKIAISLEIEKPRPAIERLFPLSPLLLISRHYAQARGYADARETLQQLRQLAPQADLLCTWGEQGAWLAPASGGLLHRPAETAEKAVDTLGAGDTFNAGIIHARSQGLDWSASLDFASRLAAYKCGRYGFAGLEACRI